MNDPTNSVSPCIPAATIRPRGDVVSVTIIILVLVLSSLYLATLGMTTAAIGSLLTTTSASAGYLVRQLGGQVDR